MDENQINIEKINEEIKDLREQINQKMDSYFILDDKAVYDTMIKFAEPKVKKTEDSNVKNTIFPRFKI